MPRRGESFMSSDYTDSGEAFELDTLGTPNKYLVEQAIEKLKAKDEEAWEEALRPPTYDESSGEVIKKGGYMSKEQEKKALMAIKEACDADPDYDPDDPKKVLANDMQYAIAEMLGGKEVLFYSTVGTAIDKKGIDGFFYCDGEIVTIDVTKRPGKGGSRSDFVLQENRDIIDFYDRADKKNTEDGSSGYLESLLRNVRKMADLFKKRGVVLEGKPTEFIGDLERRIA